MKLVFVRYSSCVKPLDSTAARVDLDVGLSFVIRVSKSATPMCKESRILPYFSVFICVLDETISSITLVTTCHSHYCPSLLSLARYLWLTFYLSQCFLFLRRYSWSRLGSPPPSSLGWRSVTSVVFVRASSPDILTPPFALQCRTWQLRGEAVRHDFPGGGICRNKTNRVARWSCVVVLIISYTTFRHFYHLYHPISLNKR